MSDQRMCFSKTDTARYISHLDLMRTFQRAFFRAGIAVRHTEGYNPHAYISLLLPLPLGFSSVCEILQCGLPEEASKTEVPALLNAVLPAGITVHDCYDAVRPAKQLSFVEYVITLEYENGVPAGSIGAFQTLLKQDSLVVTKKSRKAKSGSVQVDLIPLIRRLSFEEREDTVAIEAVLRAQNPGMNPELLVTALGDAFPDRKPDFAAFHRKALLDEDLKPFA